ncbi:ImmA/IrrE family metallo-endopeptidase [Variovorax guangxiensis]|uniref:ImmA/IrrE family metallo-endopeptidase n=1 Tax=Variovorax guangxiensis TaxID=1775474 RepID=UPI0028675D5D|nr:ImmA/IrrE family metallo-endopeptidase [Variovorax guangxiensis]MDR6857869.1 hypothetical protein [Variovorax guangxiensis]
MSALTPAGGANPHKASARQTELIDGEIARSLLDQLLDDSRLYRNGSDYHALLDFVVRLRNFAPFNAMLLQIQKPGLSHAASAPDWRDRFDRHIKDGARPLLILRPFGPVALVYDVLDTDGAALPSGIAAFTAEGDMTPGVLDACSRKLVGKGIEWSCVDAGDNLAGSIQLLVRSTNPEVPSRYRMRVNRNHDVNVQFATLTHELGHLFLGHLGADKYLNIPNRPRLELRQRELEAESVAYIVCGRNSVENNSKTYLADYVTEGTTAGNLDLYQVMRATGQVETLLGLAARTRFERPTKPNAAAH